MMDPDMRLLAQVIFSDRLQAAEKERARQRSREGRIRRPLNVRGPRRRHVGGCRPAFADARQRPRRADCIMLEDQQRSMGLAH